MPQSFIADVTPSVPLTLASGRSKAVLVDFSALFSSDSIVEASSERLAPSSAFFGFARLMNVIVSFAKIEVHFAVALALFSVDFSSY